jgi:hypothetical protein
MASQDPSTAYGAAPEKPKSFFSSFPSFSLPKLPDFFGTGSTPASAPVPAPAPVPPGPASQSAAGRRRRRGSKKAGRRRRHRSRKGGLTPAEGVKWKNSDIRYMTEGSKAEFPPTQVRKPTGKGRRTHRVKKHSRR